MANPHRGETTLSFAGRTYTLRPTFHILASIEQRLGLSIPQLLCRVEAKGLLACEIMLVLSLATRHDGSAPFRTEEAMQLPVEDNSLRAALPEIAHFLLTATGGEPVLDFRSLLEHCHRLFGFTPAEFWQLTMPELRWLLASQIPSESAENLQSEVFALVARFPDESIHAQVV